jgi:VWFA-related protein
MTGRFRSGSLVLVTAFVGLFGLSLAARAPQASQRTVYVTVVDQAGKPVTGLGMGDLGIKEDNVIREVTAVKPATDPLYVSVLVDTTPALGNAVQDLRASVTAFVHDILAANPKNMVSFGEFGGQAMTDVKFTSNAQDLDKYISKLFPKPDGGSVLFEGLMEASKDLQKVPSARRAIVTINMEPEDEVSHQPPPNIAQAAQKGGASVWGVSVQGVSGDQGATASGNTASTSSTGRNPNTENMLNGLAQNTGGMRIVVLASSALEAQLKDVAACLNSQYEVTFNRPAGAKPAKMTQAGVARAGARALTLMWSTGK